MRMPINKAVKTLDYVIIYLLACHETKECSKYLINGNLIRLLLSVSNEEDISYFQVDYIFYSLEGLLEVCSLPASLFIPLLKQHFYLYNNNKI